MSQFMQKGKQIHSVFSQSSAQPEEKKTLSLSYIGFGPVLQL